MRHWALTNFRSSLLGQSKRIACCYYQYTTWIFHIHLYVLRFTHSHNKTCPQRNFQNATIRFYAKREWRFIFSMKTNGNWVVLERVVLILYHLSLCFWCRCSVFPTNPNATDFHTTMDFIKRTDDCTRTTVLQPPLNAAQTSESNVECAAAQMCFINSFKYFLLLFCFVLHLFVLYRPALPVTDWHSGNRLLYTTDQK